MKKLGINISKYFFLLLFLGFFGSITLFNHAHVVDGVTIVHSHPFKSERNNIPSHSHTSKGFLLIHLLVNIIVTTFFTFVTLNYYRFLFNVIAASFLIRIPNQAYYIFNPLRGPPEEILI